jgi:hypothetical protein
MAAQRRQRQRGAEFAAPDDKNQARTHAGKTANNLFNVPLLRIVETDLNF